MRRFISVSIVFGTVVLLGACSSDRTPRIEAANASTPPANTAPAASADYLTSGPLVVEHQVDVAVQRDGVVAAIAAEVGARVHKGELLAQLDSRQLQADRDAAEARVRSTQFELQHWEAEIKIRQSDLSRDEDMFKENLITAKQVEHSRYAVAGVQFETERERQNLKNAQETLRSLELELEKTRIQAPFDGVVARRYVRAGQRVAANDRAFWVTEMAPLNVKFTVPQQFVGKLRLGDRVSVSAPGDPARAIPAKVTVLSPVVDPSSGTLEVQAQVEGAHASLVPGMTVNIRVPASR